MQLVSCLPLSASCFRDFDSRLPKNVCLILISENQSTSSSGRRSGFSFSEDNTYSHAASAVTWWKPIKYVNSLGGRWPHASAYLILEDVWPSLVACMRLQTSATSLLFSIQAVKMLPIDRSWLLDRRAQLRDDSSTSEEEKERASNEITTATARLYEYEAGSWEK